MTIKVPFDPLGSLIRDPSTIDDGTEIDWRCPEPFKALLKVHKTRTAHGYGRYITWAEVHGIRQFPMAIEDLMAVLRYTKLDHGVIDATWIPKERRGRTGPAYGIALLRKTFLEQEESAAKSTNDDDL